MSTEDIRYVGIDYSMTSPAMCVCTGPDWSDCVVYYLTSSKKFIGKFGGNMIGTEMLDWSSQEQRYDFISDHFVSKLRPTDRVLLEGYAFGATGQVFNIGENTGVLKYKMHKLGIPFGVPAPSLIKKFATGKGNSNKIAMNEAFETSVGSSVRRALGCSEKQWSPSSDVIDAYFISKLAASKKENGAPLFTIPKLGFNSR